MKNLLFAIAFLFSIANSNAQEVIGKQLDSLKTDIASINSKIDVLKRLKISGYIQPQFQVADSSGQDSYAGGNFKSGVDKRFTLRRGRVKVAYTSPADKRGVSTSQFVFQLDASEKGFALKDAYVLLTDKWSGWVQVKAGMFDRPFGYEIGYSSSARESPERGRMSQILFPGERDLGATIAIQGHKSSKWNWIRIEGGFFNGIGAPSAGADASDFDKTKDFIGRISMNQTCSAGKIKYGFGASAYNGGFRVDADTVYTVSTDAMGMKGFKIENASFRGKNVDRKYMGVNAQFSIDWSAGTTALRAEYIQGDQPGTSSSSSSPKAAVTSYIYKRSFNGAYFYFLQDIGKTPFQAIVKYDWYDPNTDVEGDNIGKAVDEAAGYKPFNKNDLRYDTWGLGMAYQYDSNIRLTIYYDIVQNETSKNIADVSGQPTYMNDRHDNVLTLRLQVKF
jgi:hypothetical protein